jgi:hypothetical protein
VATPGRPRPEEPAEQFDGGYAYVIRAADNPVPPGNHARPANSAPPADSARPADDAPADDVPADVYVYRDTSEAQDAPAAAAPGQGSDEGDASYWYDLSGGDGSPVPAETRGPFEPLLSSSGPPPVSPSPVTQAQPGPETPNAGGDDGQDSASHGRTDKLEQIKDFYLTAEAIGEQNLDKHYDQMLAQQRELISEYFKQSGGADPAAAVTPEAPAVPGDAGDQAEAPYGASVVAEPPRVW